MTESQRGAVIKAAARLRIMVVEIETALIDQDQGQLDLVRLNGLLSTQIEDIERVRLAIERAEI